MTPNQWLEAYAPLLSWYLRRLALIQRLQTAVSQAQAVWGGLPRDLGAKMGFGGVRLERDRPS